MVIAVTYDNENVGQHFGHAENFKLYEIFDGKVVDSAVIQPFGQGHDAVVGTMLEYNVSVVICGGIGAGAIAGLSEAGISCCSNISGLCDDAVEAFLAGSLQVNEAANCDCNHHEGHDHGSAGCGSGCGSCCSGCH